MDANLKAKGFRPTLADPCYYMHAHKSTMAYLILHVDDFRVASNDPQLLQDFVAAMRKDFDMKVVPTVRFLGVEIERNEGSYSFGMPYHVHKMLSYARYTDITPCPLPAEPKSHLLKATRDQATDETRAWPYRQVVMVALWLVRMVAHEAHNAVSNLTQHLQVWTTAHIASSGTRSAPPP